MSWLWRYRIRLYIRNSIWVFPALSIVAGLLAVEFLTDLDRALGWQSSISPGTATTIMGTVAGSIFTLLVLVCSTVLVAVQLASGQLTPRLIALIYRNPFRKAALAVFTFTFTFSVATLPRLEAGVPWLTTYVAAYGFLLNLVLFLYFMEGIGKTLRPSAALRAVALMGREVIREVYPQRLDERRLGPPEPVKCLDGEPDRVIHSTEDGAVLAFDLKGLVALAEGADCLIELMPEVGDYVTAGEPLFRIFQGGDGLSEKALKDSVALGPERTLDQDPMFAFRIIVDIASKALSPAINDPTTAVLAIDQIHHLLRDVGSRYLLEGQATDGSGRVRLVYRTPYWEDFFNLGVIEIRQYGRDSIQVMRRLRAMLENLLETLPAKRAPLLRKELSLLERSTKRMFPDVDDQLLAEVSDLQGMGGSRDEGHGHEQLTPDGVGSFPSTSSVA